jgi:hypothetical protein
MNIDLLNYSYQGETLVLPPLTCIVCIPCNNHHPQHHHDFQNCILLTYERGWDFARPQDFITVYVVDSENQPLTLEIGELLASFLLHSQEMYGVGIDKCLMGCDRYLPETPDSDGGYVSDESDEPEEEEEEEERMIE